MAQLRNVDRTDRELLHLIASVADADGIASAEDVAAALDVGADNGRSAGGRVAPRLSWMARYGFLAKVDPQLTTRETSSSLWVITELGAALMGGRLKAQVARTLDENDPGTALLVMRRLMQRSYIAGPDSVATAVRREYLHNAAKRLAR